MKGKGTNLTFFSTFCFFPLLLSLPHFKTKMEASPWSDLPSQSQSLASASGVFPSSSGVFKQGWLQKQGGVKLHPKWQRRWFRLTMNRLAYFRSLKQAETGIPTGEIPLRAAEVILLTPAVPVAAAANNTAAAVNHGVNNGGATVPMFSDRLHLAKARLKKPRVDTTEDSSSEHLQFNGVVSHHPHHHAQQTQQVQQGSSILEVRVPGRKTYYLKGRSDQEMRLWRFHLLQAQRLIKVLLLSSLFFFFLFHSEHPHAHNSKVDWVMPWPWSRVLG